MQELKSNGSNFEQGGIKQYGRNSSWQGGVNGRSRKIQITAPKTRALKIRMTKAVCNDSRYTTVSNVRQAYESLKRHGYCLVSKHYTRQPSNSIRYNDTIGLKNQARLTELTKEFGLA